MDTKIKIGLTTKAGTTKGLNVVLTTIKTGKRHYIKVPLKGDVYSDNWNDKAKKFFDGEYAIEDNKAINEVLEELNALADTGRFNDGPQLKKAFEDGVKASTINHDLTFGEYLSIKLEAMKAKAVTTTHECYNTLNNKMQGTSKKVRNQKASFNPPMYQGMRIYDMPLKKINNAVFKAFIDWILNERNGEGFINTCTCFKAIMNEALDEGLTEYQLTTPFRKKRPNNTKLDELGAKDKYNHNAKSISVLSADEWQRFLAFNPSELNIRFKGSLDLIQLYIDAMKLMYYTLSRPCDVLGFRWCKDYDPDNQTITYIPQKLRGKRNAKGEHILVTIPLCAEAIEIIHRYKGQSKGGYLLPFKFNERTYNLNDPKDCKERELGKKSVEQAINKYLKRIAQHLGFDVADLKAYDFRHTAITHALNKPNANIYHIAKMAGTSVEMIESHYGNYIVK